METDVTVLQELPELAAELDLYPCSTGDTW
jgi:hypothetical protein